MQSNESVRMLKVSSAIEVIELDDVRIQILGVAEAFTLADEQRYIRDLLAWCDGSRKEHEVRSLIVDRLPDGNKLVDFLKARNILVETENDSSNDPLVDYIVSAALPFTHFRDARRKQTALNGTSVCLTGNGTLAEACREVLSTLGLKLIDKDKGDPALTLALSDVLDHASMRELNRRAFSNRRIILFASMDRFAIRVGPLVVPGESACFECYHHRLRSQLNFHREFDARADRRHYLGGQQRPSVILTRAGAALVATAVCGFVFQHRSLGRPNVLIEQDLLNNSLSSQPILKLPRCPVCGPARTERLQRDIYSPLTA